MVDNIDNNPSSTTADIFSQHKYVLSFENEGKMWMLSESVDMSTWKYGVPQLPADYTHIFPVPSEQFMPLLQGHCKPVISRIWKLMTGKRRPKGLYTLCGNSAHHK